MLGRVTCNLQLESRVLVLVSGLYQGYYEAGLNISNLVIHAPTLPWTLDPKTCTKLIKASSFDEEAVVVGIVLGVAGVDLRQSP